MLTDYVKCVKIKIQLGYVRSNNLVDYIDTLLNDTKSINFIARRFKWKRLIRKGTFVDSNKCSFSLLEFTIFWCSCKWYYITYILHTC